MALGGKHSLPGFEKSLEELRADILMMAALVRRSLSNAKTGLVQRDEDYCSAVIADEEEIALLERQVDRAGTKVLIRFQPLASDFRAVLATIKLSSHLENISDQAVNVARRVRALIQKNDLEEDEELPPPRTMRRERDEPPLPRSMRRDRNEEPAPLPRSMRRDPPLPPPQSPVQRAASMFSNPPADSLRSESDHWRNIRDSRNPADFMDYLARYGPNGAFAVTGTQQDGRVIVWEMPDKAELDRQLVCDLSNIELSINVAEKKARFLAMA